MKKVLCIIVLVTWFNVVAQTNNQKTLQPSELEQAKLAKLKAQNDSMMIQLQQIDTQMQALNILKQMTTMQQQQKYSEYLGESKKVIASHTEWGDMAKVNFNPTQGESGSFTITTDVKK